MSLPVRRAHPELSADGGFTLLELLVAMSVLTIVMTLVFSNMGSFVNSEVRTSAIAESSAQVQSAYMQLDSEVRYASDIDSPGEAGGDYWVEFQSDWTASSLQYPRCTQLEYNTTAGILQQRSWLFGSTTPSADWQILASSLSKTITSDPFALTTTQPTFDGSTPPTLPSGSATSAPMQLVIDLTATAGYGPTAQSAQSSFSMTAINSISSPDQDNCGGYRS